MISTRMIGALVAALAVTACGGGSSAPLLDLSKVGDGDGSLDSPYVLPAEHPIGTTGGMGDYFNEGGVWQVGYSHQQVDLGAGLRDFGALVYDTMAPQWILTVDNQEFEMSGNGDGTYSSAGCSGAPAACVEFEPYQDPATSLYGIFAVGWYEDTVAGAQTALLAYGGMKTPVDGMPTSGSAVYVGTFSGFATNTSGAGSLDNLEGTAAVGVNFVTKQVTFSSIRSEPAVADYDLTATAELDGNSFAGVGTLIGTVTPVGGVNLNYTGSIEGAFFGPGAAQTAGIVETTADGGSGVLAGGFWAAKK